jgi:beta-glucanase (GH16 family)
MFEKKYAWTLALAALAGCDTTMQTIGELSPDAGGGGADGGDGTEAGGSEEDGSADADATAAVDAYVAIMGDDDDGKLPAPWIEVWRDDFRGPAGSAPDPANWNIEVNGRPDNKELQYYTARRENTFLDGYGHLVIQAFYEKYMGSTQSYTSGRMNTAGHFEQTYGRFEARIKIPAGTGLWPAFWLLGANIKEVSWPACGEIDIMENAGSHPQTNIGSVHGTNLNRTGSFDLPGGKLSDAFHLYALEWTPDSVKWFVDGTAFQTFTKDQITAAGMSWGLDHPFYILLNLAVGGTFDGNPGLGTKFPAQLWVDRVTVGRMPGPGDDAGGGSDAAPDTSAGGPEAAPSNMTDAEGGASD